MNQQQFNSFVYPEPNTGCWLWGGRHDSKGYGRISHIGNHQVAHRQSYEFANGKFDYKLHVLHKCDTPACVNPDHLYLGDQRQNNIDRDTRGRQKTKRGCDHKLSRFSEDIIREIRDKHNPKVYPSRKLAKMFNCSQRAIMNIIQRKSYKNVL